MYKGKVSNVESVNTLKRTIKNTNWLFGESCSLELNADMLEKGHLIV